MLWYWRHHSKISRCIDCLRLCFNQEVWWRWIEISNPLSKLPSFSLSSSDGSGHEDSGSTVILDCPEGAKKEDNSLDPLNPNNPTFDIPNLIRNRNEMQLLQQVASSCLMLRLSCDSSDDSDIQTFSKPKEKKPKHFYKLQLFQKTFLKIRFDRLALLALLDRWDTFDLNWLLSHRTFLIRVNHCSSIFILYKEHWYVVHEFWNAKGSGISYFEYELSIFLT